MGLVNSCMNCHHIATPACVTAQGMKEIIDPVLNPLLARSFAVRGKARMLRMRHREVEVAPGFRLALTTNLGADQDL